MNSAVGVFLFFALFIFTFPVWAQDSTKPAEIQKEKIQQKVETKKERLEERKDTVREKLATKEAVLKKKLETFKDKKRAEVLEKVNQNLNLINKKYTDHMLRFLDNASKILSKLEQRLNSASPDIKDPTAARLAISEAKLALDSARSAVAAQAAKDYTLNITSEAGAKKDAKKMRDLLHADLKSVREQVIAVKKAVSNAIRVAKSGKVEVPGKEATESGQ